MTVSLARPEVWVVDAYSFFTGASFEALTRLMQEGKGRRAKGGEQKAEGSEQ